MSTEAYVYEAIRTPRGRGKANGALHGTKPVDLVVGLIRELRERLPGLDPAAVDDIVLGVVSPVGEQGSGIARIAAIAAGLPDTVAGVHTKGMRERRSRRWLVAVPALPSTMSWWSRVRAGGRWGGVLRLQGVGGALQRRGKGDGGGAVLDPGPGSG